MLSAKVQKNNTELSVDFKLINTWCRSGPCPAIYKCTNGDYVIQGYVLTNFDRSAMNMSDCENAVYIPKELLENL